MTIHHSLFIKNPADSPSYKAYFEPLHWYTWCAMAALIFISPLVLWLTMSNENDVTEPYNYEFTFSKSIVLCGGMISFARPWSVVPDGGKGKLAFFW